MEQASGSVTTIRVGTAFCRPCNRREAVLDPAGRCMVCGQYPDQPPAGECTLCGGAGVLDGLVIGDEPSVEETCRACGGVGSYGMARPAGRA